MSDDRFSTLTDDLLTSAQAVASTRLPSSGSCEPQPAASAPPPSAAFPLPSESWFRSLIENALDIISILDQDGTIRYESPAIRSTLGYAPEEVTGQSAFHFIHPDDVATVAEAFGRILQQHGVTVAVEYRFRHRDGSWRMLESRGRNLIADPAVQGIVVNSRDVTEARAAERDLRRHQADIEALNIRLKRGMEETHHRVKNNLQIIAAMIDMQTMEAGATVPVEEFHWLGTQIRTLAIVHDALTKEVKEQEQWQRISARDVLNGLLPMLQQMALPRRVTLVAGDAGVTTKQGTSLALVMNEIFLNALKHGQGDVHITLQVEAEQAQLEVHDRGPGFPPDFDVNIAANTGLELVVSLSQTDLAGRVAFLNHPEGGARVVVTFPLPPSD